ncbi:hypothetical protein JTE90_011274, partial [Oedothorax gibbosus]
MATSQIQELFCALTSQVNALKSEILVALVVLVVCYLLVDFCKEWKSNTLPGPYGLPLVGYIPFISDPLWDIYKLGEKYGDVVRFKVGSQTTVLLHGVEVIKEALSRPEFLGRPPNGHRVLFAKDSAFFNSDMRKWREQRRFVVQSMKDLGLGKTLMEGNVMDEIHHFLDKLRVHNGAPVDLKDPLTPSVSNNISSLVFGKRYEYENPDRVFLDKNLEAAGESFTR